MPIKCSFLLVAAFLMLSQLANGQVVTDSSQYRQAKLGIWCETTRFIYADNGADSLLQRLDCRNWDALRASLELNALGEKPFFEAIEKPAIYAGYTSYDAKLGKLIEEIGKKLKSSPSRRASEARLQGVDSLQRKLTLLASNPAAYAPAGMPVQAANSPAYEGAQGQDRQQTIRSQPAAIEEAPAAEEGLPWLEIAQWALLALLAAALGWQFKRNASLEKELNLRMARRKQEIANLAVKKDKDPLPLSQTASAAVATGMEEKEVLRLIRKELDRFRQQQQMKTSRLASTAKAPQSVAPKREVPERKEVLTGPEEKKEQPAAETGIYYDKLPFKGGFHQNHLSRQPHADSIYTIQVLQERPEEAAFWVTEDQDVQKYAMQNGLSFFEEACDYSQLEESPSRVRNLEKGLLRKRGHLWEIEKKAKVSFE